VDTEIPHERIAVAELAESSGEAPNFGKFGYMDLTASWRGEFLSGVDYTCVSQNFIGKKRKTIGVENDS